MTTFDRETGRVWKSLKRMDPTPAMTLLDLRSLVDERRWRPHVLLWRCTYCSAVVGLPELSFDHARPRSLGGETHPENLVESCRRCNTIKGALGWREFHDLMNLAARWPDAMRSDLLKRLGSKPSFRWAKEKAVGSWDAVAKRNQAAFGRGRK